MKAVEISGEREARLVDQSDLRATGNLAVVRVLVTPMCTESKTYRQGHRTACLGHEAAGEVVEALPGSQVKAGDRVVVMPMYACGKCALCLQGDYIHCQSGRNIGQETGVESGCATYAEFLVKPDYLLVPIPDDIPIEHAAMLCCGLGPTFGAMQRLRVDSFDTLLITGMGPVGLGGVINGVFRGARVIAVESHPYRAELALSLGASAVVNPNAADARDQIAELTGGIGVDKAIDCTGVAAAQRLLIDSARRRGEIAFIGEGGELSLNVSSDLLRKGLTLHGCWHYNRADIPRLLQVIRASGPQIDKLITHHFPMRRVQDAFELQLTGNCGKVLLYPGQESGAFADARG